MRAFIAIELPVDVRARLVEIQRQLAQARADVKWVEAGNLHLTMRFLGEIAEDQRRGIEALLHTIAARTPALQVQLSEIGAFPALDSPRVIWVGIGQGCEALAKIAGELEEGLATLGVPREDREFAAHVTVGRVRSSRNLTQLSQQLERATWTPPPPFLADHLTLFQSVLSPSGPLYTTLACVPFGQSVAKSP